MFRPLPPLLFLIPLALTVTACDRKAEPAPPAATSPAAPGEVNPTPAPVPSDETVSIIRPDIEEARPVPLEPLKETIDFGSSGVELAPEAIEKLRQLVETPQVQLATRIMLRGHSDSSGRVARNMELSRQRANAVRDWLVAHGVPADRITVVAFGAQNPVRPNALPDGSPNEKGRAANRRVEIHVAVPQDAMMPPKADLPPPPQATGGTASAKAQPQARPTTDATPSS